MSSETLNDFTVCKEASDCVWLAQSVERLPLDPKDTGSNPGAGDSVYESTIALHPYDLNVPCLNYMDLL